MITLPPDAVPSGAPAVTAAAAPATPTPAAAPLAAAVPTTPPPLTDAASAALLGDNTPPDQIFLPTHATPTSSVSAAVTSLLPRALLVKAAGSTPAAPTATGAGATPPPPSPPPADGRAREGAASKDERERDRHARKHHHRFALAAREGGEKGLASMGQAWDQRPEARLEAGTPAFAGQTQLSCPLLWSSTHTSTARCNPQRLPTPGYHRLRRWFDHPDLPTTWHSRATEGAGTTRPITAKGEGAQYTTEVAVVRSTRQRS